MLMHTHAPWWMHPCLLVDAPVPPGGCTSIHWWMHHYPLVDAPMTPDGCTTNDPWWMHHVTVDVTMSVELNIKLTLKNKTEFAKIAGIFFIKLAS